MDRVHTLCPNKQTASQLCDSHILQFISDDFGRSNRSHVAESHTCVDSDSGLGVRYRQLPTYAKLFIFARENTDVSQTFEETVSPTQPFK